MLNGQFRVLWVNESLTRPICLLGAAVVLDPDQRFDFLPKFRKVLHAGTAYVRKVQATIFIYHLCNIRDDFLSFLYEQLSGFAF